uniref:Protein tweety homolog n=1 Tax=Taeniopygia guttata TaxID=59729 RepID=H0YXK4_TAEGU
RYRGRYRGGRAEPAAWRPRRPPAGSAATPARHGARPCRLPGALVGGLAARAPAPRPAPTARARHLPPAGPRLPAVAAFPGLGGRRVPRPQPPLPHRVPDLPVLLQEGPGPRDQAAPLVLCHLDGRHRRAHLLRGRWHRLLWEQRDQRRGFPAALCPGPRQPDPHWHRLPGCQHHTADAGSAGAAPGTAERAPGLAGDYLQSLKFTQQLAGSIVLQLQGLPAWRGVSADLTELSGQVAYVEYYRWLAYLLFFILVLTVCLLACLGLAKHSRCLLLLMLCSGLLMLVLSWASMAVDTAAAVGTSDFCVAPDKFIMNQTDDEISTEVVHYYLYCDQSLSSPFQQALTVFQRSLTTMQIQIQGLIQYALPLFPTAEKDLLGVQKLLNSSETSLHQLTALLDCRGLHKDYLDGLIGICYDGVEGLLYLGLFSLLAAAAFSTVICAAPRAWQQLAGRERDYDDMDEEDPFNPQARRMAAHRPPRGQLRSFCSYSSSLGSQSSLQPPAQTVSNAPVSEYMNQAVLFGGNPRYENVPLIGRGSPPPTVRWAAEARPL